MQFAQVRNADGFCELCYWISLNQSHMLIVTVREIYGQQREPCITLNSLLNSSVQTAVNKLLHCKT